MNAVHHFSTTEEEVLKQCEMIYCWIVDTIVITSGSNSSHNYLCLSQGRLPTMPQEQLSVCSHMHHKKLKVFQKCLGPIQNQ